MITERQDLILNNLIRDYIDLAEPVSSRLLEENHKFGLSPATLRIEMQRLTDEGYLFQPHTSAGRIPTDKGYRFFVDNFLGENFSKKRVSGNKLWEEKNFKEEFENSLKLIQFLTKNLSELSSGFCLSYFEKEKILWKEGWQEVLREPEFNDKNHIFEFVDFLDYFEENIGNFSSESGLNVYIGKESKFPKSKEFSVIFSSFSLPEQGESVFAILGPKRMPYEKNIGLIESIMNLFE